MNPLSKVIPLILVTFLFGCAAVTTAPPAAPAKSQPNARTPCVYEIPDGFTGWVLIEFENSNCPPTPIIDGKRVFRVGSSGRLCTSSKMQYGVALDDYYYVGKTRRKLPETGWGAGGMIWGGSNGSTQKPGEKEILYERFYVGTEAQFDKADEEPLP